MASNTAPTFVEFNVPDDATQNYHVEGLPFGTRGGMLIEHEFPADGEYVFRIVPIFEGNMGQANDPFGQIQGERLAVTIDGQQVKLFDWDKEMRGAPRSGVPTPAIHVTAGLHKVGVTFLANNYAPDNNINDVFLRATIETGGIPGYLFFPHVGKVKIEGPSNASGASDTPSRRRIFVCRPATVRPRQEEACARTIVSTLARRAFRRPVDSRRRQHAHGVLCVGPSAPEPSMTASKRPCAACSRIRNSSIGARSPPRMCEPAGAIASATWRWRPGCRSSSGAACRTTSS